MSTDQKFNINKNDQQQNACPCEPIAKVPNERQKYETRNNEHKFIFIYTYIVWVIGR